MSALDRLKEKVDSWKAKIRELQESNEALSKEKASLEEELEHCRSKESHEVENLREQLASKEETILVLQQELQTKDAEIEAIIAKVEALLE